MSLMADSIWLDFGVRGKDIILQEHQRPYTAFRLLPFPEVQEPQIITLVGVNVKTKVSRDLFGFEGDPGNAKVRLYRPLGLGESESMIFIADSHHQHLRLQKIFPQADTDKHVIRWHQDIPQAFDPSTLAHLLCTQILVPFSNVVCLFSNDFGV
jgi:hypothetical protein